MLGPGGGKGRVKSPQVVPSFRFHKEGDHAEISEILQPEQASVFNLGEDSDHCFVLIICFVKPPSLLKQPT